MNKTDIIKNISTILSTAADDIEKYIEIFQDKIVVIK